MPRRAYQTKCGFGARGLNERLGLKKYARNGVPINAPASLLDDDAPREGPPGWFFPMWLKQKAEILKG